MQNAETAWVSITRLGGCNYRLPITRRGRSVYVDDPQDSGVRYRLSAARFDAGEFQTRNSWAFKRWDDAAARTVASERNWQT